MRGNVFLVGCGPGDPELLTVQALKVIRQADVVLFDRLVPRPILDLANATAKRIDVGKRCGEPGVPQPAINRLLAQYARAGKRVVRLKSGDPFIFGRGGEELEYLAENGVPVRIVPGITAAIGAAAYTGIPLTHRHHAQRCLFVTGHGKDDHLDLDWHALAQPRQTVVVYMGIRSLPVLVERLMAHGAAPDTPVAIIERATLVDQRSLFSTIANIADEAVRTRFRGPAIIIIGAVVEFGESYFNLQRSAREFEA